MARVLNLSVPIYLLVKLTKLPKNVIAKKQK